MQGAGHTSRTPKISSQQQMWRLPNVLKVEYLSTFGSYMSGGHHAKSSEESREAVCLPAQMTS